METKIYSAKKIGVGTFLGGPLVAGYLIAANFNTFNEVKKARWSLAIGILVTIVVFGGIFLIPDMDSFPQMVIPLLYTATTYGLVDHYQAKKIKAHAKAGGTEHSVWKVVGIALTGLVVTLLAVMAVLYVTEAGDNTVTNTYGSLQHEIAYDPSNLTSSKVDAVGHAFMQLGFFDQEVTKYLYAQQVGPELVVSISCASDIGSDPSEIAGLTSLLNDTRDVLQDHKIVFHLVDGSLENVVKKLE